MNFSLNNLTLESIGIFVGLYAIKILTALVIFFIGKFIAKRIVRIVQAIMRKSKIDETLVGFAGHMLYALALAFIIIAALSQLGVDTTSLTAAVAAAGLAIGLALQGSLANFAAGVVIILFRPFKIGDFVDAAGIAGIVEEISILTTQFRTPDNKTIIVPNSTITGANIINFSAKPTRRIDLVFGVSYSDDLKKVREILTKIIEGDERILKDPEPVIAVHTLGDNSVDFVVRPWVKSEHYWDVYFFLQETVKTEFDKQGVSIPFPQRDLHLKVEDLPGLPPANDVDVPKDKADKKAKPAAKKSK
ncbi:MAG: mechanosensitive ion channel family protein [Alphaproteobacteria bacterium]